MTFHPTGQTIGNLVPPLTVANGGTGSTTLAGWPYDATAADFQPIGTAAGGSAGKPADAGHVHPVGVNDLATNPSDVGLIAWSSDIGACSGSTVVGAGVVNLVRINVRQALSVTNAILAINSAPTGLTSGQNFVALYNSSGTQLGVSADQTTPWATTGVKVAALSGAPIALSAGTFVWVVFWSNFATTAPGFYRVGSLQGSGLNLGVAVSVARWATNGTATTTLGSLTPGSNVLAGVSYWAGLS